GLDSVISMPTLDRLAGEAHGIIKLRFLWTVKTLNGVSGDRVEQLINDTDEFVRCWGLRLATDFWPIDTVYGQPRSTTEKIDRSLLPRFTEMAKDDSSSLVRLVLASTLQRLPTADRPDLAAALLSHAEDASDHNLPKLIWYGLSPLVDLNPNALVPLATEGKL